MDKREQILEALAAQEGLRGTLDDHIIDATIAALQNQLHDLDRFPEQQRKQITVLFMDIVGSSKIGLHLDPEDTLDIMDSALKFLGEPVQEHGGRITRYMGDGFKAVFGAPMAQENDPEMAVRAGLMILERTQEYEKQLQADWGIERFQVRIGINTGMVALGGLTEGEDTIMGSTVNLAARMESAALPGNLLISQHTFQHVRGLFEVAPLDPITVKGFDHPVAVYIVNHPKPRAFRKFVRGLEGIHTRMVGRDTEFKYLQDSFYTAQEEGEGQVVTIIGEAGVGKSRLLGEFLDWLAELRNPVSIFQGQSMLETQHVPYGLLKDLFSSHFQDPNSDENWPAQRDVEMGLNQIFGFDRSGEMRSHIIGQLLGYDYSTSPHLRGLLEDAQQLRNRAVNYLAEYFQALSRKKPVVIFLEDIHWADDSTLDIIDQLGSETANIPLVIFCLARERLFERRPYWGEAQSFHTRIHLKPLSKRQSRLLLAEILNKVPEIPNDLRELVISGSEGNPYYIEELIKMLISEGVITKHAEHWQVEPDRLAEIHIPPTLMGVLQARLDGLPVYEKITLQTGSVIGRNFWDQAVRYITNSSSPDVQDLQAINKQLDSLRSREMVFRREASEFPNSIEYSFKHSLLRDVAYESVLKKNRKVYHKLVADWLIGICDQKLEEYSGLIAKHLENAGENERAFHFLQLAGERATRQYANEEAIAYFTRALAIYSHPDGKDESDSKHLQSLHESLGNIFSLSGKHAASRKEFQQAMALIPGDELLELARLQRKIATTWQDEGNYDQSDQAFAAAEDHLGPEPLKPVDTWWQEWIAIQISRLDGYYARADTSKIISLVEKVQPIVERFGTPQQHAAYFSGQARMYFRRDRYTVTDELLEVSRKLVSISQDIGDKQRLCDAHFEFGFTTLWYGDLELAEEQILLALSLAKECSNLYSQTLCNTYLTILYRQRRDLPHTEEYIRQSISTATDRNMINYLATARGNQAWFAFYQGKFDQVEDFGQQALKLWSQVPFVYPFQWTALWPLIAVAVEKNDYERAVHYAGGLLAPDQQCLPGNLAEVLQAAIDSWQKEGSYAIKTDFQRALQLASEFNLL